MTPENQALIETLFAQILQCIEPETHTRSGLAETPKRVAKAYQELFAGYGHDGQELLGKTFQDDVLSTYRGAVIVGPVSFYSQCEHHMAIFHGTAFLGYIPGDPTPAEMETPGQEDTLWIPGKVVGLSKLAKLVELYARRLQVQERLTQQITNDLEKYLQPKGVMVVMEAVHTCMCARGARAQGCKTMTSCVTGVFDTKPEARAEFLHIMEMMRAKS